MLDELPDRESFHQADMLFESLSNLSPRRIRLFMFFADRHGHTWRKHIDPNTIDLGSGKRMLMKGGTAINFFVRDLPRLSVDIDLTYLPIQPREISLAEIGAALTRTAGRLSDALPGAHIQAPRADHETRTQTPLSDRADDRPRQE